MRRGRARWRLNRPSEAMADGQQALALLPDAPRGERARLLSWMARTEFLRGHYREAIAQGESALGMAREMGLSMAVGEVLNTLGMARIALGDVEAGEAMLREAIRLAREQDDSDDLTLAYSNLATMLRVSGRIALGLAVASEGEREVKLRYGQSFGWLQMTYSTLAFDAGEWDTARALVGPPLSSLEGVGLMFRLLRDAEVALGEGNEELARETLEAAEPLVRATGEAQWHGMFGALVGESRRRLGDLDGGQAAVARALDELEVCTDDVTWIARVTAVGLGIEADRAVRARDLREPDAEADAIARARIHLDRLEAAAEEGGPNERAWFAVGAAENARARGCNDPALWRAAGTAWAELDRPYCRASMQLREAEALVECEDRTAAAAAAAAALTVAETLGAGWLAGELRGLATRARLDLEHGETALGPSDAPTEAAPFGLTPRELQVLALIAEGASNRQIGATLFMAEKTASVHVSRILAKLEVQSRTQAAAVAHRLHLT
jgi:ATP/maltotriose-dependent transcriptional regulator MalT